MVFLFYSDILPIIVVLVVFMLFQTLNKILIPRMYMSVLEFIYEGNVKKTIKCTIIRTLIVILICIGFYQFFHYTEKQLYLGLFIGSFLIIWPAMIQYRTISIFKNKVRQICLLGYLLFMFGTLFTGYITLEYLRPMIFDNREFFLISNSGINILVTLVSYVVPVSLESLLAKNSKILVYQDIDTFHQDIKILNAQIDIESFSIRLYEYEINHYCKLYNVNLELVKTILALEQIKRGQWFYKYVEILLCRYFPTLAIKYNVSVGLAQISIATAKNVLKESPIYFMKKLIDPKFNISVCCQFLRQIINEYDEIDKEVYEYMYENVYEYIAWRYLCEAWNPENKAVLSYAAILKNKCSCVEYVYG